MIQHTLLKPLYKKFTRQQLIDAVIELSWKADNASAHRYVIELKLREESAKVVSLLEKIKELNSIIDEKLTKDVKKKKSKRSSANGKLQR